jgi:hypothetical protein
LHGANGKAWASFCDNYGATRSFHQQGVPPVMHPQHTTGALEGFRVWKVSKCHMFMPCWHFVFYLMLCCSSITCCVPTAVCHFRFQKLCFKIHVSPRQNMHVGRRLQEPYKLSPVLTWPKRRSSFDEIHISKTALSPTRNACVEFQSNKKRSCGTTHVLVSTACAFDIFMTGLSVFVM